MKPLTFFRVLLIWCCISTSLAFAQSPVWKISHGANHLYLGGTIHLLTGSDYPLPDGFEKAYNNSVVVVFETDLQKFQDPEFQPTIQKYSIYQGDQDITRFLKPSTLQDLETYLADRGIPMTSMVKLKPWLLSVTLTMIELQRLGLTGTGVDQFYLLRASNDVKEIHYLETVHEQLEFLSKMGDGNENELIEHTLNEMNTLPDLLGAMKNAWREGDTDQLHKIALEPWIARFPNSYNSLLVERNNNWVPQIERMLQTKEVELVLFGVLHLAGKDGLLEQLKALGYSIQRL